MWLFVWIVLQLGALAMGAMQAPLSARYPEPAERLALHVMLVVQVSSAGLLFPVLLRGWRAGVMGIAVSWPFVQLTGYLSGQPSGTIFAAGVYLSIWLGLLAVWAWVLRAPGERLMGVAAAAALSLGGALLWYLRVEFSPVGGLDWPGATALGPIVGVVTVVVEGGRVWEPWLFLLTLWVITGVVLGLIRLRQLIH